ncbi:unnamed protein product [Camellia sinensis]
MRDYIMLRASYGLRRRLTHATRWCNAKVRNGLRRNLARVLARGLRRGHEIGPRWLVGFA